MKIVHISKHVEGGAGIAAFRINEALLKNGIHSSFVSLDTLQIDELWEIKNRRTNHSFLTSLKEKIDFRLRKHLGIYLNDEKRIKDDYKRIKGEIDTNCEISSLPFSDFNILDIPVVKDADIIHLHWVADFLDYPSFFKDIKKPIVWTLHDMNPFQGIFHYKEDEIRNIIIAGKLNKKIAKLKKDLYIKNEINMTLVTPSKWLLDECSKSAMISKANKVTIPNLLDFSRYANLPDKLFKTANNIPENNIILLFVAHNLKNYRKGIDLLLEALGIIKNKAITLLVLGNGDIKIEGMDIRNLGQMDRDKDIAYIYANSDAFILPSREDNLPNVMLESLACGTPVIGFSIGGLKEHIINYQTGLLAKELNSKSLANTISEFCEKRQTFSKEQIHKYAFENFNEKLIVNKYLKVYNDLLKKIELNA